MTEPTEALIRKEIARARRILREDRILGKLDKAYPDEPEPDGDGDGPKPPAKTDPKEQPKRKGIWWGTEQDE